MASIRVALLGKCIFSSNNGQRWCRKKLRCVSAFLLFLGISLIVTVSHFDLPKVVAIPRCYDPPFQAGENALMKEILNWTRPWLDGVADPRPFTPDLFPCTNDSGRICQPANCSQHLKWDVHDRIRREMFHPEMMLTMRYIVRIQCMGDHVPVTDVILLTAAASNQFKELQAWIENARGDILPLMERKLNTSIVIVDLGLKFIQRQKISRLTGCQVVTFPNWSFPEHAKLGSNCFSWRPILIRAFLTRASHSLVYTDPDVLIHPGQIWPLLDKVRSTGVLFSHPSPIAIPVHTHKETFDYFNVDPCAFYPFPTIQPNFAIFRNTSHVSRVLVEPWTACALTPACICPAFPGPVSPSCPQNLTNHVGQCHKYDQSVLNILLAKIFNHDIHRVTLEKDQPYIKIPVTSILPLFGGSDKGLPR